MQLCEFELQPLAEFDTTDPYLLKNVLVCGKTSTNGYRYSDDCLRNALPLFESEGVNLNHDFVAARSGHPRKFTDRVGHLQGMRLADDGLRGDIQLNPKLPYADAILVEFQRNTKKVGISIMAIGEPIGGVVNKLDSLYSVDVVQKQATTKSLHESEDQPTGPSYGETEHNMLQGHEKRICDCESKLGEAAKTVAESTALATQVKNLLAEVQMLKSEGKPKTVHIHPDLSPPKFDPKAYIESLRIKR